MHITKRYFPASIAKTFQFTLLGLVLSLAFSSAVFAAIEAIEFDNTESTNRYQAIIAELRCLVCQNQNLADSDAELAKDLRRKAAQMIKSGNSNQEILSYMQDRYGDFVLYRPPLNSMTALLWVGPFILLLIVAGLLIYRIKRQQDNRRVPSASIQDDEQRMKIRNLMNDSPELSAEQTNSNRKSYD